MYFHVSVCCVLSGPFATAESQAYTHTVTSSHRQAVYFLKTGFTKSP